MSSDEEENNNEEEQEAWVRIQESTFTNWVNDKLRRYDVEVTHLQRDFRDGVHLCKLVETLVDRPIGRVITKKNLNFYQASGNIAIALEAIKQSGVRLVNIGMWCALIRVGKGRWNCVGGFVTPGCVLPARSMRSFTPLNAASMQLQ